MTRQQLRAGLLASVLTAGLIAASPAHAVDAQNGDADWNPKVSEKLIKLPASILAKRIDKDFLGSSLGEALRGQESGIRRKIQTLSDIDDALALADEDQTQALQHKYLVEKQSYIQMASSKNAIQRQQLDTKRRFLERVLTKLGKAGAAVTADRKALIDSQNAARERLERAVALADQMIGSNPLAAESKYARDYEKKIAGLSILKDKIANHAMNKGPNLDGNEVTKADYIRHMVALTEGEIALLAMEEEMLGYMAKLVALDALALAETSDDPELIDSDIADESSVDVAVQFFVE